MAAMYDWPTETKETVIPQIQAALKEMKADSWCVICKSMDLRFEDHALRWKTREEAMPHLAALALENLAANIHFNAVKNN